MYDHSLAVGRAGNAGSGGGAGSDGRAAQTHGALVLAGYATPEHAGCGLCSPGGAGPSSIHRSSGTSPWSATKCTASLNETLSVAEHTS